jgi:clan AA aspartic protease (TIGR02281 family)
MRVKMKDLLTLIMLLFLITPASAGDGDVPVFSDKDLQKYQSGDSSLPESQPQNESKGEKEGQEPARYEVPYVPVRGGARKIIIPVTVNNSLTVRMLLDTGSTGMYISSALAERLGLFRQGESKLSVSVMGAGGKTPAIMTVVDTVQVGQARDEFIPTLVEVRRTNETVFQGFEGVIGMDFMSRYSLRIDTDRHVIVLLALPPDLHMPGGHDEGWWRNTFRMFASIRAQWKEYRDSLDRAKDETVIMKELRLRADRQYKEADRLMTKLNNYAIDHVVPMEWREY